MRETKWRRAWSKRPEASPSPAPSMTSLHLFMLQFLHLLVERVIHDTWLSECQEHLCKALRDALRALKDFMLPFTWSSKIPSDGRKITDHVYFLNKQMILYLKKYLHFFISGWRTMKLISMTGPKCLFKK